MAADFKEIAVRVGADIEPLKKGFKDAGQKVQAFKGGVIDAAKQTAVLATAAVGAATALVAMANSAAEDARELKNLARVSGTNTTQFQKLAFAAKTVGIEQDKLADIFKDTKDKVGDFLQTGGGPLADFFENIAPQVGVTAEEFKYLSGPQALQKYHSALQEANVSQNEMTFFMEAIASDSALLSPLLADNGAAFDALGKSAQETGAILSEFDIEKLDQMKGTLDKAAAASNTLKNQFSAQLAPVISDLVDRFSEVKDGVSGLENISTKTFNGIVKAVGFVGDAIRGIEIILKSLELAFHAVRSVALVVAESISGFFDDVANAAKSTINGLIAAANVLPGIKIDELVTGESEATAKIREWRTAAVEEVGATVQEMHNLMMKPLPSDSLKQYVAEVTQAANDSAQAVVDSRATALTLEQDPSNAPEVVLQNGINRTLLEGHEAFAKKKRDLVEKNESAIVQIKKAFGQAELSAVSNIFGNISTLMNTENKKQFEIGKAAAKAQTVIDTYAAAQAAYKSLAGIPVVGPGLGIAAAGAATIAGLSRLQAISSTSFGGASSISNPSAGSAPSVAPSVAGEQSQSNAGGGQTLFLEGIDPGAMFSGEQMRSLVEQMNQVNEDGGQVVLT